MLSKLILLFAIVLSAIAPALAEPKADQYFRDRAVKLVSVTARCSGMQVRSASGKDYIITAGHCRGVVQEGGLVIVERSDGTMTGTLAIAEDKRSDLLLLRGLPNLPGVPLAQFTSTGAKIYAFTYPRAERLQRTEGRTQAFIPGIKISAFKVTSLEDRLFCLSAPKFYLVTEEQIGQPTKSICVEKILRVSTTAAVDHGSSGGGVVDATGHLIGAMVLWDNDNKTSYMIPVENVAKFLGTIYDLP